MKQKKADIRKDFGFFDVPDNLYPVGDIFSVHHPKTITIGLDHKESDKAYVPFVKFRGRLYKKVDRSIVPPELRDRLSSAMEYRRTSTLPPGIKMDSIYVFTIPEMIIS
jgi:hypothetical protein